MKCRGIYYGTTLLDEKDLVEADNKNKIELEYYGIKRHRIIKFKDKPFYGISIVKKEYEEDKIKLEKNSVEKISTNKNIVINILEIMKASKVTPVALEDVLGDLLKQDIFQRT